jgi:hypothetical protein
MILANELTKYIDLDRRELSNILARSGYKDCKFDSVKFVGLTNSGHFCYSVKYFNESIASEHTAKVFVSKSATGDIAAEF